MSALASECTSYPDDPWEFLFAAGEDTAFTQEHVFRIAARLGVSTDSLAKCSDSNVVKERVWQKVFQSSRLGIDRTPTIRVNGTVVTGMPTAEALTQLIDAELTRVKGATSSR
jgi:predicted DsbA family dithiol-disulfide isomerase